MTTESTAPTTTKESQQVVRPGIRPETLNALGIVRVTAAEAKDLVGKAAPGIYIPYPGTQDSGKAYGRLRLDNPPPDGGKYHQQYGTSPHIYCLPELALVNGDLLIVEGEFKAICLAEAGFPAIGISGFYSWRLKDKSDSNKLHIEPEFQEIVQRLNPKRIVYIGDPDTATNSQFSDAVASLATLTNLPVALFRIAYDERDGKGVDDIRAKIGPEAFKSWFSENLRTADEIPVGMDKSAIMRRLLEREEATISKLGGEARERAKERLAKLAIYLRKDEFTWVADYAKRVLDVSKTDFRAAVDAKREAEAVKRAQKAASLGPRGLKEVLQDFVMVGPNYYGFSVDPSTGKRSAVLTPCHKEFVSQSLARAGYTKSPSHLPNLTMMQAALWELHRTRCKSVTELLFKPYGRVVQSDGTTVFNNSQVQVLKPRGDVRKFNDPSISFTMNWLEALFDKQLPHFLSLLSYAYCSAKRQEPKKTLAIFLVGPPSSGKSLLIDFWLPHIFGQEDASDSHRLLRGENGASSALRNYICKLSDKDLGNESDVKKVRMGMLALLADFTTGGKLMYENVTVEKVINLFAFSSNPDGSVLDLLRDMPESIKSKLAIYSCGKGLLGMHKGKGIADFLRGPDAKLKEEMAAFCSLLVNWEESQQSYYNAYKEPRFGVKAWCHPDINSMLTVSPDETVVFESLLEIDEQDKRASEIYEIIIKRRPSLSQIRLQKFTSILRKIAANPRSSLVKATEYRGPDGNVKNSYFSISGTTQKAALMGSSPKAESTAPVTPASIAGILGAPPDTPASKTGE